jgi:hypothetical protein
MANPFKWLITQFRALELYLVEIATRKTEQATFSLLQSRNNKSIHKGGLQMARKKKSNESFQTGKVNGRFSMLYWDMYDSAAWQELTAKDIQLYLHMLRKYQRINTNGIIHGSNKDNISVTEKDYLKFMAKETFWKSIDHLIELGFVKLIRNGYASRECNIYGFNDEWQRYGTEAFHIKNEWLRTLSQQIKVKVKVFEG